MMNSSEFIIKFAHKLANDARATLSGVPDKIDIFPFIVLVNEATHVLGMALPRDMSVQYQKTLVDKLHDIERAASRLNAELDTGSETIAYTAQHCEYMISRLCLFIMPRYTML